MRGRERPARVRSLCSPHPKQGPFPPPGLAASAVLRASPTPATPPPAVTGALQGRYPCGGRGSPTFLRATFGTCPSHYPGGRDSTDGSMSHRVAAFPQCPRGRHRIISFEAFSGFTFVWARTFASRPLAGFSASFGTGGYPPAPLRRLPGCTDNSPGGTFIRWLHATRGARTFII